MHYVANLDKKKPRAAEYRATLSKAAKKLRADPEYGRRKDALRTCGTPGCGKPNHAQGQCRTCYGRFRYRGGP